MHPFPHHYEVDLTWEGERRARMSSGPRPVMPGGPPPEFDGSDAWWSPEHLLLEAVNLCMMNTFCALAAKAGLKFESYRGHVDGTLEKTEQGIAFTSIKVRCEVKAEDKAKADQLLHSAKKYCIVSNALKIPPILETNVL